jgi:hypothetical protein
MKARLLPVFGYWAIWFEGDKRPVLTSFKASLDAAKVLRAVRREYPDVSIEGPQEAAWLFEMEELRPYESGGGLFA